METEAPQTFEPTAESIMQGLPQRHEEYTHEQLTTLMARYNSVRAQMSAEDVAKIRAIGKPATQRINNELAAAKAPKKDATPKFSAGKPELAPKDAEILAAEMNAVMKLHPAIDAAAPDCMDRIHAELADIRSDDFVRVSGDEETPIFSEAAVALITKLGVSIPTKDKKAKKDKKTPVKAPAMEGKSEVAEDVAEKVATPKKEKAERVPGASRQGKPGVIGAIQALVAKKAMSHEEVLAVLVEKYPDRRKEGMATTVRVMLPSAFIRAGIKCEKIMVGEVKKFQIKG